MFSITLLKRILPRHIITVAIYPSYVTGKNERHLASRAKLKLGCLQSHDRWQWIKLGLRLTSFLPRLTMLTGICILVLTATLFYSSAYGANLIASHFTGNLYSLILSDSGELTVDSEFSSGNFWPSWLDLDADSKTLYVPDEASWSPPNGLTTFTVGGDGSWTPADDEIQAITGGGEVHSTLYGGQDGKGFIAFAR